MVSEVVTPSSTFSVICFLSWFLLHLQLKHPLKALDGVIGQLMNGLKQMNLHRCANVIVMGDHGTTPASSSVFSVIINQFVQS